MRKLKLQVQMTVDGFIAGPQGEMDWVTFNWDESLTNYVAALTEPVDCIVLGRKLAQGFIPHWAAVAADAANPAYAAGQKFTTTPKVVFSHTLTELAGTNTTVTNGDLVREITALKQQPGRDIIAYGGATFVSALLKEQLIDELHLFVNPVALGQGLPIFAELAQREQFTLRTATPFACGIVVLQYAVNAAQ